MPATPTLLALLGFTPFERQAFAAFFDLGREGEAGYRCTDDLWRARAAVADADDRVAMARLLHSGLLPRSVLLGNTPHAGAALQLPRPINLLLVRRSLDTLVGAPAPAPEAAASATPQPDTVAGSSSSPDAPPSEAPALSAAEPPAATTPGAAAPPARPVESVHVMRVLRELASRTVTLPSVMDARALAAEGAPCAPRHAGREPGRPVRARTASGGTRPSLEHVLVIDNDAMTLRLVAVQLQRFGFQMHLAGHPDDALRLLARRWHDYVFMDPAVPGLDALLVCRLVRRDPPPPGRNATMLVLLADPAGPAAPLARALPAADACLKKPIEPQALLRLVGEREVARVAYADTARTTTLI